MYLSYYFPMIYLISFRRKDLSGGDPPLVSIVKRKYALTTQPQGAAGVDVAHAIHIVAHRQQLCKCGRYVDTS
jgi:hypothetical protein